MDLATRIQTLRRRRMSDHVIAAILDLEPADVAAATLDPSTAADLDVGGSTSVAGEIGLLRIESSGSHAVTDAGTTEFMDDSFTQADDTFEFEDDEGRALVRLSKVGVYFYAFQAGITLSADTANIQMEILDGDAFEIPNASVVVDSDSTDASFTGILTTAYAGATLIGMRVINGSGDLSIDNPKLTLVRIGDVTAAEDEW